MTARRPLLAVIGLLAVAGLVAGCGSVGTAHPSGAASSSASESGERTTTMTSISGQAELLLRPAGTVRGLVLFMHGFGADQNQLVDSPALAPVRLALLHAGYAMVASAAHGNNFGNPASVQDQVDALRDARARLPEVRDVAILAFSMGGLDALLAASSHDLPGLRSVALLSPVVDQTKFLTSAYTAAINAAFGDPTPALVPGLVRQSDPLAQPASTYAGYRYQFWHSPTDRTVPLAQSATMVRYLAAAGITASVTPLTGDHGDLSALDPQTVVRLFSTRT